MSQVGDRKQTWREDVLCPSVYGLARPLGFRLDVGVLSHLQCCMPHPSEADLFIRVRTTPILWGIRLEVRVRSLCLHVRVPIDKGCSNVYGIFPILGGRFFGEWSSFYACTCPIHETKLARPRTGCAILWVPGLRRVRVFSGMIRGRQVLAME